MIIKRISYCFLCFFIFLISFLVNEHTVSASDYGAYPGIDLRDGNATYDSGYRASANASGAKTHARDVMGSARRAWMNGEAVLGGKTYSQTSGRRLSYDVYEGSTSDSRKHGWRIVRSGGEDFFTFDGWAVLDGYYHHDAHNHATYIGLIRTDSKGRGEKRIYKARLTNLSASKDLEWDKKSNTGRVSNPCPNTGSRSLMRYRWECNMEYSWVGFRAYLPLDDLFKTGEEVWELYIMKAVKGTQGGTRFVYDKLIIPFEQEVETWKNGEIILTSGQDKDVMIITSDKVIMKTKPNSLESGLDVGYFTRGKEYRWIGQDESFEAAVWHALRTSKGKRWTISNYLSFGGSTAKLSWRQKYVDVTVHHKDARQNKIVRTEIIKAPYNSSNNFTIRPKTKGNLVDKNGREITSEGFSYVADPSRSSQSITRSRIKDNFEVTFTYQAYVDVIINHIDANTNEVLLTEETKAQYNDSYEVSPKRRGYFENTFGYPYVAISDKASFNRLKGTVEETPDGRRVRKQIINFYYKPVLPDPSRQVEANGGRNTHGHADGKAFWELRKENENNESIKYVESNFTITGTHADTKNEKHILNLGNNENQSSDPIALIANPSDFKNENMEYDFEYEYTNHYDISYVCTERIGNDCVEWEQDKIVPAWDEPYIKKFKLSESEGEFSYYTTSRLGRINNEDVIIYNSPEENEGEKARERYGYTYYIKEKAVRGNDVYYHLSNGETESSFSEQSIGWVKEQDLRTYTHYGMDNRSKIVHLNGEGSAFSRVWGWSKQRVFDLSDYEGSEFHVNLTETVGDNIWYRGKIEGEGNDVWVHQDNTDSIEVIKMKPVEEKLIKEGKQADILKLKMDHKHRETIKKDTIEEILSEKLLVGRSDTFTEKERIVESYYESFKKTSDTMKSKNELKTQSSINVKPDSLRYFVNVPSGNHKNDDFIVLRKGNIFGRYFPVDVDDSLKGDLENHSEYKELGDYVFFLQQSKMKDRGILGDDRVYDIDFVSDYFFVSEKTGFVTTYPYAYQLHRHLMYGDTKPTEEMVVDLVKSKFTSEFFKDMRYDFKDEIIGIDEGNKLSDVEKLQRYYIPISPSSGLKPKEVYTNKILLENIGLSDVKWEFGQEFMFEHYLYGSGYDEAWFIEQVESKNPDFTNDDVNTLLIKHEDKENILESIKERPDEKVHQIRVIDLDYIDEIKDLLNRYKKDEY